MSNCNLSFSVLKMSGTNTELKCGFWNAFFVFSDPEVAKHYVLGPWLQQYSTQSNLGV